MVGFRPLLEGTPPFFKGRVYLSCVNRTRASHFGTGFCLEQPGGHLLLRRAVRGALHQAWLMAGEMAAVKAGLGSQFAWDW